MSGLLSDDRLALRATKGDRRAFAAIYRRYHQDLHRYCLAIVGNPQDAQDALQNTMVKVLGALPGEERSIQLKPWLYRIAHNEAVELLRRRRDTRQLDPELAAPGPGLAEEAASRERLGRLISDLDELPERQRGALVMRELAGLDFEEIGATLGTSSAVARQTLYEARLSLRQMDEGREMSCETVTRALSDGDGRVTRRRDVRAHLRACAGCRRFREEIEVRERDLAALSPLPAVAAAGLLQGLLGGGHGAGGGGLAGALGGGAAKSLGASAALKGAATVAVVAAIGAAAADRGGLIHVRLPGEGGSQATQARQPAGAGSAGGQPTQAGAAAVSATAGLAAGAKGVGHLGASQAAKPGAGKAATSGSAKTNAEIAPGPASQSNSVAHPHGKGHEKQLPSASAHGQQTAAGHKTANHATAGAQSHPEHPSKPSHPAQPSNSSAEKGPSSPPANPAAPETHAHGNAATQSAGIEGASSEHEAGKP
ncbi:MAG TPA: sigma-70 family RNA polymerase sigma factor [Solirubrobacterales bacterium]|jgi:RNA polymerase sigma factor (sigma-70 family)